MKEDEDTGGPSTPNAPIMAVLTAALHEGPPTFSISLKYVVQKARVGFARLVGNGRTCDDGGGGGKAPAWRFCAGAVLSLFVDGLALGSMGGGIADTEACISIALAPDPCPFTTGAQCQGS